VNKCSNIGTECSKCPLPAARWLSVACLRHSLIAFSITFWSRRSHSSSTLWRSTSTSVIIIIIINTVAYLYSALKSCKGYRGAVVHGCTHTLVGSPTLRSRWGSDPTVRRPYVAYRIRTASRARPTATRRTFDAAG